MRRKNAEKSSSCDRVMQNGIKTAEHLQATELVCPELSWQEFYPAYLKKRMILSINVSNQNHQNHPIHGIQIIPSRRSKMLIDAHPKADLKSRADGQGFRAETSCCQAESKPSRTANSGSGEKEKRAVHQPTAGPAFRALGFLGITLDSSTMLPLARRYFQKSHSKSYFKTLFKKLLQKSHRFNVNMI
jgi:hypothetical protein